MEKFEIKKVTGEISDSPDPLKEYEYWYEVEARNFKANVCVFQYEKAAPFVHKHVCSKGGELLWGFGYWHELQVQVLEYHLKVKEEK